MSDRIKKVQQLRASGEGGFTLIELLVVIVILGILSAVVVFAVGGVGDKGQESACKIDTRTIRTAEEAYAGSAVGGGNYGNLSELKNGGFLSEVSTYHDVPDANIVDDPDGGGPLLASFQIHSINSKCGGIGLVNGTTIF